MRRARIFFEGTFYHQVDFKFEMEFMNGIGVSPAGTTGPVTQQTVTTPRGHGETTLDELRIRIWDERHWLSLPFNERSSGFRWFFSFLAAFSQYESSEDPIIILLDEPGLGLHARAQKDFVRFITERLAKKGRQVLYTTHSPFMVEAGRLERVRNVEDHGRETGSTITKDVVTTDADTVLPLTL